MLKMYAKATYLPRRHPFQLSHRCQTTQNPGEFDVVLDLFDTVIRSPERKRDANLSPRPDKKR